MKLLRPLGNRTGWIFYDYFRQGAMQRLTSQPFRVACTLLAILFMSHAAWADTIITEASYFTRASCLKEGTSGIMANGKELNDERKIAASWDYPFGTLLRVTNIANGRSVVCGVEDRGPNRKLYRMGRRLDLSKAAFGEIADLKSGIIKVQIEKAR